MRSVPKRFWAWIVWLSGVGAVWREEGIRATLLLSVRWLVAATLLWCLVSEYATGWPEGVLITVVSDSLGAILGTTTVGTLVVEAIVVLAKLVLENTRRKHREEDERRQRERLMLTETEAHRRRQRARDERTERRAREREQERIRQLEELLRDHNIEIPPDLTAPAEPADPTE